MGSSDPRVRPAPPRAQAPLLGFAISEGEDVCGKGSDRGRLLSWFATAMSAVTIAAPAVTALLVIVPSAGLARWSTRVGGHWGMWSATLLHAAVFALAVWGLIAVYAYADPASTRALGKCAPFNNATTRKTQETGLQVGKHLHQVNSQAVFAAFVSICRKQ